LNLLFAKYRKAEIAPMRGALKMAEREFPAA
jgi:hypothetical protein